MICIDVVREVCKNVTMAIPAIRTARCRIGRTSLAPDVRLLDRYAFSLLRKTAAVCSVKGADIFEIGPGDNLCSGLAFLAAGARSYTCADRFPGDYCGPKAREWYRLLKNNWEGEWPENLDVETFPRGCPVTVLPVGIEGLQDAGQFDIVCSFAVGEHVTEISSFCSATARLLHPRGVAVHVIDFSPHDCWRERYADPFTFLRFPGPLWWAMGSNRGTPNRRRFHEFVNAFNSVGLSIVIHDQKRPYAGLPIPRRLKEAPPDSIATSEATFVLTLAGDSVVSTNVWNAKGSFR